MFHEILSYSRMALAFRNHLRTPLHANPEQTVRRLLENREENFLALARGVLSKAGHPYAQLFQTAGCAYADLEASVRSNGVETALAALLREGVYVTHDEFRGRAEIVRGGRHIRARPSDWLNQRGKGRIIQSSSGSSGAPVKTGIGSEYLAHQEACTLLLIRELDLARRAAVNVGPILPGFGILAGILASRLGIPFERWYAPGAGARGNLHYRTVTRALTAYLRRSGANIPYATYLGANDYSPVAEYLARRHGEGVPTVVGGFVSSVTRIAAEAVERGLDLTGCRAILVGEALTDAKRAVIEAAGIEPYPTYGASDAGSIGSPCAEMNKGNCVHVNRQSVALTTRPAAEGGGPDSLCVTSLLPFAPRVLINVEIGDTGIVEKCRCRCSFSALGLDLQVRNIAAVSKVTAQGITISASDLVELLEETMCTRFGGRPGDYQLVEREGAAQTEAELRVRPGVTAAPPHKILEFFLSETRRLYGGSLSVLSWTHSGGIRVELAPPELAGTAKFRAVRLLGPGIAKVGNARAERAPSGS